MAADAATGEALLAQWDAVAGPEGVTDEPAAEGTEAEAVDAPPARGADGKFTKGKAAANDSEVPGKDTAAGSGQAKPNGATGGKPIPAGATKARPVLADVGKAKAGGVPGEASGEQPALAAGGETPAELAELAKKHGFVVEGGKVVPRERHAFREERRQARAELQKAREAFDAEAGKTKAQLQAEGRAVYAAKRALDADDFDGFAQALGHKDWNALNEKVINRFADPNYKRLQELERDKQQREQREAQQREQQIAQAKQQQELAAQAEYKQGLSATMAESSDPFVAAMADDPAFVNAIFRIQEQHFDGHETITAEEAVRLKPKDGGSPLLETLRGLYNRLHRSGVFAETEEGARSTQNTTRPAAKQAATGTPRGPAKKVTTTLSQKDAQEATGAVDVKNKDQFFRYALAKLNAADKAANSDD